MGDHGIKVAMPGVDVKSANPYQLQFSSEYFNFKEMASGIYAYTTGVETTLSSGINDSVTTIPVNSTANYSTIGVISIYGGVIGEYEYIKYTGISGNSFTGCTRGYWSSTKRSWDLGDAVEAQYTKKTIYTHNLGYYPVAFIFAKDVESGGSDWTFPLPVTAPYWNFYYYITSTTIEIVTARSGALSPYGAYEEWNVYYHIMYDKIKS